jgi:hypothetical protein
VSVFLALPPSTWIASNALAFAVHDAFPVSRDTRSPSPPRRPRLVLASEAERGAVMQLVDRVKSDLDGATARPDGYNVGEAAAQTVMHFHEPSGHAIDNYPLRGRVPRGRTTTRVAIRSRTSS